MGIGWQEIILAAVLFQSLIAIVLVVFLAKKNLRTVQLSRDDIDDLGRSYEKIVREDVYNMFSPEFRQELRNSGQLHFEKVLTDNASFLQQDLQVTTSQLSEHMKQEIAGKLEVEFMNYQQALKDAQQVAADTIKSLLGSAEAQRAQITTQLEEEVNVKKGELIAKFEENMADVVNHYLIEALGNSLDLKDQVNYIIAEMERNKAAMAEDMRL